MLSQGRCNKQRQMIRETMFSQRTIVNECKVSNQTKIPWQDFFLLLKCKLKVTVTSRVECELPTVCYNPVLMLKEGT